MNPTTRAAAAVVLVLAGCRVPAAPETPPPGAVAPPAAGPEARPPAEPPAAGPKDDAQAAAAEEDEAPKREPSPQALRREAHRVVDDWHAAASVGDADRYLGHLAPDAVFMGTDASERWDLATFGAYVERYFKPGEGWTYVPSDRVLAVDAEQRCAWFDERLTSEGYGQLRGTGVLRRSGETWKLVHYSMTFTVPNDVARDVVTLIRAQE